MLFTLSLLFVMIDAPIQFINSGMQIGDDHRYLCCSWLDNSYIFMYIGTHVPLKPSQKKTSQQLINVYYKIYGNKMKYMCTCFSF